MGLLVELAPVADAAEKCVLEYLMKIPVGWAGIIKAAESRRRRRTNSTHKYKIGALLRS